MAIAHILVICDSYFNDINCLDDVLLKYNPKELTLCLKDNYKLKQHFETSLIYSSLKKNVITSLEKKLNEEFDKIIYFITNKDNNTSVENLDVPESRIETCISSIVPKYCHFKLTPTTSVNEVYRYMGVNSGKLRPEQKIHKLYTQQKRKRKRKKEVLKKKSRDTGHVDKEGAVCQLEEYE